MRNVTLSLTLVAALPFAVSGCLSSRDVTDEMLPLEIPDLTELDEDTDSDEHQEEDTGSWNDAMKVLNVCEDFPELSEGAASIALASDTFGLDLFSTIMGESVGGNVLVSPLSLHTVLTMAYNGASGVTAQDMGEVLGLDGVPMEEVNEGYADLISELAARDEAVEIAAANSMWIDEGFPVDQGFVDTIEVSYDALVQTLDFGAPDAAGTINQWVSDNTGGHIDDLIPDPISSSAVLYLVNAVFFDAPWTYMFAPEDTAAAQFEGGGGVIEVDMMSLVGQFLYFETEEYQMVQLPYGKGVFAMSVLLPKEAYGTVGAAATLTVEDMAEWNDRLQLTEVALSMPRFQVTYDAVPEHGNLLNDALDEMGMFASFCGGFDGISEGLRISKVKQKTFMEVAEEGTEAAAASMVEFEAVCEGGGSSMDHAEMYVDRPFLVLIRDRCGGGISFIGVINDPEPVK